MISDQNIHQLLLSFWKPLRSWDGVLFELITNKKDGYFIAVTSMTVINYLLLIY